MLSQNEIKHRLTIESSELFHFCMYILTDDYNVIGMLDTSNLLRGGQTFHLRKLQLLRELQIFRDCFDIVSKSKNIETAKSRVNLLHNKVTNIEELYVLFGDARYDQIQNTIGEMIKIAHTSFYLNYYHHNIDKMEKSKRQGTKDKYRLIAIESLQQGMLDSFTDKSKFAEYLKIYNINQVNLLDKNTLCQEIVKNDVIKAEAETVPIGHEVAENNTEVYKALGVLKVRHLATLDFKCCLVCACLDGEVFEFEESIRPCIHDNCRCIMLPFSNDGYLGNRPFNKRHGNADADGEIGTISAETKFKDWFLDLNEEDKEYYLGAKRYDLHKNYGFKLTDFVDLRQHRELSLIELEIKKAYFIRNKS